MNRKSVKIFGLGLAIVLLGCTPSPSVSAPPEASEAIVAQAIEGPQSLPLTAQFQVNGQTTRLGEARTRRQTIRLEEARTPREQEIGLMFRRRLGANRGMLFTFDSVRPLRFWMRNTLIPLDMVFLRDGVIRGIVTSAPPCTTPTCPTYGPNTPTNQVIELRGGRAAELGLRVGQRLEIKPIN